MRVLLVEDEKALNEVAAAQIERRGHEVIPTESITEAEAILDAEGDSIDCIVADHRLPDGGGVAMCIACRKRFPRMSIGVVSGCLSQVDRDMLEHYGIPYWRKPIVYSVVMAKLGASRRGPPPPNMPVTQPPMPPPLPERKETLKTRERANGAPKTPSPEPAEVSKLSSGPEWPDHFTPKQRLNNSNHLAPNITPKPKTDEDPPPKKGFTRRLFSLGKG